MSETTEQGKHTPGPWIAIAMNMRWHGTKPIFPNGLWHVFPAGDTERLPICTVDCGDDHDDATRRHAESDARLIAAAPDGLETAETTYLWMLIWLPLDIRCKAQAQLCSLRNFIASATGRTQEDVQDDFESKAAIAKAEGRQ